MKQINFAVNDELHHKIKIKAATENKRMPEIIIEILEKYFKKPLD